jgi:hypothetical protein
LSLMDNGRSGQTITEGPALHAENQLDADQRARLTRWRWCCKAAAIVLGVAALLWLAALSHPTSDNVEGVLFLEAVTLAPLGVLLWLTRRLTRRLHLLEASATAMTSGHLSSAAASAAGPAVPAATTVPLGPPPALRFDPSQLADVVLRPRLTVALLAILVAVAGPAGLVWLDYNAAIFDPRTLLVGLYGIALLVITVRARIVVADRIMWRRSFNRYRPVSLDALRSVELTRARYLKQQGVLPVSMLRLSDRYGRRGSLKPVLWTGGARRLLAVVEGCVRAQGITVDATTARRLARASTEWSAEVPAWAYHPARPDDRPLAPAPATTPKPSTFWIRRNPDGTTKKAQPQLLIPMVGLMVVMLPVMVVAGRAGTNAIRSARCNSARPLWTDAPDFPGGDPPISSVAQRLIPDVLSGQTGRLYTLQPTNIVNSHNTAAVQRDAATMTDGFDVEWGAGSATIADVQIELFPSHAAAVAFQRDYDEDHCHVGDKVFSTPEIPGGVGLRCSCTGSTVSDRIAFVRGRTRVQAIAWSVPARQGHGRAITLADDALAATSPGTPV